MYSRVSRELRNKMENDLQEIIDNHGTDVVMLRFNSEEQELYKECVEWKYIVNSYFLHTHSGGALKDFLDYKYIRPWKIFNHTVIFTYDINWNRSWRDWFIIDERRDYASIFA